MGRFASLKEQGEKVLSTVGSELKDVGGTIKQGYDIFKSKRDLCSEYAQKLETATSEIILDELITKANNAVFKNYLTVINEKYKPLDYKPSDDPMNRISAVKITKWVFNKEESIIDKLKNVYNVFSNTACNIAMMLRRKKDCCDIYILLADSTSGKTNANLEKLLSAIRGNFPGAAVYKIKFGEDGNLAEGEMRVNSYYKGLIEFAIKTDKIEEYYTVNNGYSVAAVTNIASEKSEKFLCQGIEKLLDGIVPKKTEDEYTVILLAEPCTNQDIENVKETYNAIYTALSPYATVQKNISNSESNSEFSALNAGIGVSIGINANLGASVAKSNVVTNSDGTSLTYVNYKVQHTLKQVDSQMERLEVFESLGMWNFAAYVISKNYTTTNNVAEMYRSLTQGEKSLFEKPTISIWENGDDAASVLKCLANIEHPFFELKTKEDEKYYPKYINDTTFISGLELAQAMNLPRKSIVGIPIVECTEFGRDVISYDNNYQGDINLGEIYHMHHSEGTNVKLNKNSLTSHAFITGSTGAGKSNTVFAVLNEAIQDNNTTFLVVEPAKGEYKNVFGNMAKVYGTNPKITSLLRINPFAFPENIAVNEHIDRLVEIFNVCWPMYAAMPAILKDAVIRAYESAGWDLELSENKYDNRIFPTFADVLTEIRLVLQESEYSSDNKGDYSGALVTRLKSLTNGINGQIFNPNALSDKDLFDENVIVDLSRVGSTETKAMIMGLLVMKLQEYRLSSGTPDEKGLKHITVLEEAHNLLKRTSTEQSSESSNLLGKSVEMLANSIAELRAFGEGFIIADQSPGLLDMSVIRNTNTKIIHRLPDFSDRELVGKAAGLNDDQITELAKLQMGVAAVYQNDWINPVLCKVHEFNHKYTFQKTSTAIIDTDKVKRTIYDILIKPNEFIRFKEDQIIKSNLSAKAKTMLVDYLSDKSKQNIKNKSRLASMVFDNDGVFKDIIKKDNVDIYNQILKHLNDIGSDYSEQEKINLITLIVQGQAELNAEYEMIYKNYAKFLEDKGGLI